MTNGRTNANPNTLRIPATRQLVSDEETRALEAKRAAITYRPENGFLKDPISLDPPKH